MPTPPFDDNSQLRLHASHSLARGASWQLSWREAYKTAAPRGRIFLIIHNIGSWLLCPCGRGGLFGFFSSARYLTDTNGAVFLFLVLFSVFLSCHQCGKRYSGESGWHGKPRRCNVAFSRIDHVRGEQHSRRTHRQLRGSCGPLSLTFAFRR